uniref:ATP synthase subunit a n=1 Tax=Marenzelleria neglecta TaxID=361650 RepID=A0A5Q0U0Y2_MARNE|nr:ATPase subunit 6 [Marenzelleria neglecta]
MFLIIHPILWLSPSRGTWVTASFASIMNEQANRTFATNLKGFASILSALFILIISLNLMGVLPYVFSTTSHLLFSLSLGFPIWASMIISGIVSSPSSAAAHLLPAGAPSWLNPFLVLVETLSILVRPVTLCFRLAANLSAGHVVIGLVGSYLSNAILSCNTISWILLMSVQTGYTMFEFGVSLIQAYIFCLLLSLYSDDHPSHC